MDNLVYRTQKSIENKINFNINKVALLRKHIGSYNVEKVLKKGYAIVKQESNYVLRAINLNINNSFTIKFFDNEIEITKNGKKES